MRQYVSICSFLTHLIYILLSLYRARSSQHLTSLLSTGISVAPYSLNIPTWRDCINSHPTLRALPISFPASLLRHLAAPHWILGYFSNLPTTSCLRTSAWAVSSAWDALPSDLCRTSGLYSDAQMSLYFLKPSWQSYKIVAHIKVPVSMRQNLGCRMFIMGQHLWREDLREERLDRGRRRIVIQAWKSLANLAGKARARFTHKNCSVLGWNGKAFIPLLRSAIGFEVPWEGLDLRQNSSLQLRLTLKEVTAEVCSWPVPTSSTLKVGVRGASLCLWPTSVVTKFHEGRDSFSNNHWYRAST